MLRTNGNVLDVTVLTTFRARALSRLDVPAVVGTRSVQTAPRICLVASAASGNMIRHLVAAPHSKLNYKYATTSVDIVLATFQPGRLFSKRTDNDKSRKQPELLQLPCSTIRRDFPPFPALDILLRKISPPLSVGHRAALHWGSSDRRKPTTAELRTDFHCMILVL